MAPSSGHLLVPKAMRLIRFALEKTTRLIRDKLPQAAKSAETQAELAYARLPTRQPINRVAAIRQSQSQSQSRWYSTKQAVGHSVRHFSSQPSGRPTRASYPSSRTAAAVGRSPGRAPFASTLRPNLTGGTLCRSAGGYGVSAGRIGGARYFSHSPAAPAQVIQNVSQAVRAFWLSGSKARFDGVNPKTGEKRFRAVSELQEEARHKMDMSASHVEGSYIDFKVTPTITAIGPLSNVPRAAHTPDCESENSASTLNNITMMSNLSVDFARALKDLAAIMNDLKRLATLGDLPITLENSTTLRVSFPGCDADTVEGLCRELNIRRGIVGQDEEFDIKNGTEMALLFPFAPSKAPSENMHEYNFESRPAKWTKRDHVDWHEMLSPAATQLPGHSHRSMTSHDHDFEAIDEMVENPWVSSPSGYSSLHATEPDDLRAYFEPRRKEVSVDHGADYEGLEGIYKFIAECDRARVGPA